MQLKYSFEAQFDLEYIAFEGRLKFGKKRSDLYLLAIEETVKTILSFPEIGKVPYPDDDSSVRSLRSGVHMIFYQVTDEAILIDAVIHGRANTKEILASRRNIDTK